MTNNVFYSNRDRIHSNQAEIVAVFDLDVYKNAQVYEELGTRRDELKKQIEDFPYYKIQNTWGYYAAKIAAAFLIMFWLTRTYGRESIYEAMPFDIFSNAFGDGAGLFLDMAFFEIVAMFCLAIIVKVTVGSMRKNQTKALIILSLAEVAMILFFM